MRYVLLGAGLVVLLLLAAAGLVTLWAAEGSEVVVLHTARGARSTRVWIVDDGRVPLVEAANPERPFLADLVQDPMLEIDRNGRVSRRRATVLANPEGHERVRRLLAAKYGWADRWTTLIIDLSRSVAIRLDCDH